MVSVRWTRQESEYQLARQDTGPRGEREKVKEIMDGQGLMRDRGGANAVHCLGSRSFGKGMEGKEKRRWLDVDGEPNSDGLKHEAYLRLAKMRLRVIVIRFISHV